MTRVLVVDDENDIRLLVRLILDLAGMEVVEAASGEEALTVLRSEAVDVMLLDLRIPAPDGWAVLEQARAAGLLDRLSVIVVSAHADPAAAERAQASGCSGYLSKPFLPDALLAAVRGANERGSS